MRKIRAALAIVIASAAVVTLTGCVEYSEADARATPYSVIETEQGDGLFTKSSYSYVNPKGNLVALSECEDSTLFEQRYCEDIDGVYRFTWSNYKGSITSATYTIDGVEHDLDCNTDSEDAWNGVKVCLPKGTPTD